MKNVQMEDGKLTFEQKMDICKSCKYYHKTLQLCKRCGCFLQVKARIPVFHCPIKKW